MATTVDLDRTKIRPPALPPGVVERPRLIERLSTRSAPLICITAPAGFGKTVLVLDWLERGDLPFAWLSLDRHDSDPGRLLTHLAEAVGGMEVDGADGAADAFRSLARGVSAPALTRAREAVADLGPAVLVVDDVHALESPAAAEVIASLAEPVIEGPRIVLLSRVDPPLPLGRLRLEGAVLELRERDLRFTTAEAEALLGSVVGGLDGGLAGRLGARTEGWAAGLRMAAIALSESDNAADFVESFDGGHRYVTDYLLEEAVGRQDPAVQRFLMDTALLPRFTVDAAVAVTEDTDAPELLRQVEEANLFLFDLGDGWYRYHQLFGELLGHRLRRLDPDRVALVHLRASRWFEGRGEIVEALEHAARAGSDPRLVELLDAHGLALLGRSELAALGRWLGQVAEPRSHDAPLFLATLAWHRLLTERAPNLVPVLDALERAMGRADGYDDDRRRVAGVERDLLRAFSARLDGRLEDAVELSDRALQSVPNDDALTRGRLLYNQARARSAQGRARDARELLEQAFEANLAVGNHYMVLTGMALSAHNTFQLTGCRAARDEIDTAMRMAGRRELDSLPAFTALLNELGRVHWAADALEEADLALNRAREMRTAESLPEGLATALVYQARVAAARLQFDDARNALARAAALARDRNVILLDTTLALEQIRLSLLAEAWGEGAPVAHIEVPGPETAWTTVVETRLGLALVQALRGKERERAHEVAKRLEEEAAPGERGSALLLARFGLAMLAEGEDRWDRLGRCLETAAVRGEIRPFLDVGEPARQLLQAGMERSLSGSARALARRVLERLAGLEGQASRTVPDELVEPLTDRELDTLEHLSGGLTNKAIAKAMFVSPETVKTHLKHIYGKLGVSSREQAVARARELGLLPPG